MTPDLGARFYAAEGDDAHAPGTKQACGNILGNISYIIETNLRCAGEFGQHFLTQGLINSTYT